MTRHYDLSSVECGIAGVWARAARSGVAAPSRPENVDLTSGCDWLFSDGVTGCKLV